MNPTSRIFTSRFSCLALLATGASIAALTGCGEAGGEGLSLIGGSATKVASSGAALPSAPKPSTGTTTGSTGSSGGQVATGAPSVARILGGSPASAFPESALVDLYQNNQLIGFCSGSVVAPRVVLTAGHCGTASGADGWVITAPFANGQQAIGTSSASRYQETGEAVNPNSIDLAVIFLDRDITLSTYPTIQQTQLPDGSQVVDLGRIQGGQPTNTFFVSPTIQIFDASSSGFPFDYIASEVIESGDSGGPVIQLGTHNIVAVNSGAGGGTEVLARTDAAADWLAQQIAAGGGGGNTGGSTGGNTGGSTGGNTGGATDCNSCINDSIASGGSCGSEADTCRGDQSCLDLNSCLGNCADGDQNCINTCAQQDQAGINDFNSLVTCVNSACQDACNGGGAAGGSTGGTDPNGGSTGGTDPNGGSTGGTDPNGGSTGGAPVDCNTCVNDAFNGACGGQVQTCSNDQSCVDLYYCLGGCDASDQACINYCARQSPDGIGEYNDLANCVLSACSDSCQ
jgi:hypothetical protein